MPLPIAAEYMGRSAFDLAEKYGKDTFIFLKYLSPAVQTRMFAFKTWANGIFSRVPGLGPTFADTVSQFIFDRVPAQLPKRLMEYRDRFEHHLILTVSAAQKNECEALLKDFFASEKNLGDFFVCTADEEKSANLNRFGAASAATRYAGVKRKELGELIPIDVALPRDEWDWLETLPAEIANQLDVAAYYGHFFCHVMHQDYVAKRVLIRTSFTMIFRSCWRHAVPSYRRSTTTAGFITCPRIWCSTSRSWIRPTPSTLVSVAPHPRRTGHRDRPQG